jgi:ABC-type multidrug transport system ATPase subunit
MGAETIFSDLSFSVSDGQGLLVTGRNGSGKTLLLNMLCGGFSPSEGALQHHSSTGSQPIMIPAVVDYDLDMSCKTFISIWGGDKAKVAEEMNRWDLHGLEKRKLRSMSLGERKRVLLVCGLSQESDLYCLDEPTSGLDGAYFDVLLEACHAKLDQHAAVIVASHDKLLFAKDRWAKVDMEGKI